MPKKNNRIEAATLGVGVCSQGCRRRVFVGRAMNNRSAPISFPHIPMEKIAKPTSESANMPIETFRSRGVAVSIFKNVNGPNAFFKTTIQKRYLEGEQWKTTTSFGRDDLPIVNYLVAKAYAYMLDHDPTDGER